MTLIKTSLLSLVATVFKITYGLVIGKLLAVYGGASGLALVGQFQNIQAILMGVATAGFGQGLTKYLAEFREDVQKSRHVFATAVKLVCILLFPIVFFLFFFAEELSLYLFTVSGYEIWLQGLSLSLIPASLGALFLAALNGLGEVRYLTAVGVLSSCLGIALVAFLVPIMGTNGVVLGLLLTPFLVMILSAWYLYKSSCFSWAWLSARVNQRDSARLAKFTLMALASVIAVPVSHILIRNHIGDSLSLDAAGLWTGLWRLSEAYLLVITMTLSVYYLPKLSSLQDRLSLLQEMKYGYKMIMPMVLFSGLIVYLLREPLIILLFTEDFLEMKELFFWQLVGDFVKMACFLMGFVLIAKGMAKIFIVKELSISIIFVLLTYVLVERYALFGVTYAYVIAYCINFIWLVLIMRHYFAQMDESVEAKGGSKLV